MRRRVSRRRVWFGRDSFVASSKCFTKTVPAGKTQGSAAEKRIFVEADSFGIDAHRDFAAPSDQNGTFRSYGMRLSFGISRGVFLKAWVWERRGGAGSLASLGTTSRESAAGLELSPNGSAERSSANTPYALTTR